VTTVTSDDISGADASFVTRTVALDPALLKQAHSYRLRLNHEPLGRGAAERHPRLL